MKTGTDKEWLEEAPPESEIEIHSTMGGKYIPIEKLRPLLDRFCPNVKNYRSVIYKDNYANLCAHGTLELTVTIDGKERTVTGAYNLIITDAPNGFWNGTLKSDCIKNAAAELGKRLGRDLNKDMPISEPQSLPNKLQRTKPDSKIMKQYKEALERNDEAAITTMKNIYEIN